MTEKPKIYTGEKTVDPTNGTEKPRYEDETMNIYILLCIKQLTPNESKNSIENVVPQNCCRKKHVERMLQCKSIAQNFPTRTSNHRI